MANLDSRVYDPDAEQALLSHLFTSSEVSETIDSIAEILDPEDLYEPRNSLIYSTILSLHNAGRAFDPVQVLSDLRNKNLEDRAGGLEYFQDLLNANGIASYGTDPLASASTIRDYSIRRKAFEISEKMREYASVGSGLSGDEALEVTLNDLQQLQNAQKTGSEIHAVADLFDASLTRIRNAADQPVGITRGVPSGFVDLDECTSGFRPNTLTFIAARPAVGKSTLAVDFARNAAFLAGKTVVFFSLEMGKDELVDRIISAESNVESQKMKTGQVSELEWAKIEEVRARVNTGSLLIDDNPQLGLPRLRASLTRQMSRPEGCDLVIIDYLQLMEVPRGYSARQEQVSELSRGLKLLAKELGVPIIVLAQLNRKSEERTDRKPAISDLRESGSLEQDADIILLLHRPDQFDAENRPGETDLIIGKNRGGPSRTVPLVSMLSFCKFVPGQGTFPRTRDDDDGNEVAYGDEESTDDESIPW